MANIGERDPFTPSFPRFGRAAAQTFEVVLWSFLVVHYYVAQVLTKDRGDEEGKQGRVGDPTIPSKEHAVLGGQKAQLANKTPSGLLSLANFSAIRAWSRTIASMHVSKNPKRSASHKNRKADASPTVNANTLFK